jgi:uncharacterized protein YkwD
MVQKHLVISMIAPLTVAGILIMTILAATANAQESNSTENGQENNNAGNVTSTGMPENVTSHSGSMENTTSGMESNNTGNAPESNSNMTTAAPSNMTTAAPSNMTTAAPSNMTTAAPSNMTTPPNIGNARESNNTGNVTSPSGSTASNNTNVNTTNAYCDSCNNDIYYHHPSMDFASMVLAVHNRERAAVGVDSLTWSEKLAADAKVWADHLATTGEFVHDTEHLPTLGEGENLAAMSWMGSHNTTVPVAQNMQGWIAEKNSYQGLPSATGTNVTGHYTQMVWRNTKEIGCATATSTASGGGREILVCRYSPPGNFFGQKPY